MKTQALWQTAGRRALSGTTLLLMLAASAAGAQTLTVFEPLQAEAGAAAAVPSGPVFVAPGQDPNSGLLLRSASRFGDEYLVVLADRAGNTVDLRWSKGQKLLVPQHPGYVLTQVEAAEVTLQQPPGSPCTPDAVSGVRCIAPDTAVLSLATLGPVQQRAPAAPGPRRGRPLLQEGEDGMLRDSAGNPIFVNPFTGELTNAEDTPPEQQAAARAQRAQARTQRVQQFQVERIPDDQVPPGMRLVRTPFGDRLVPLRE
jgi:hypothetical protein